MSILIKGMEMPKGNSTLNVLIYSDGRIFTGHKDDNEYSAVEVPTPHGRLCDVDALCEALIKRWNTADKNAERIISEVMADVVTPIVASAPTIIEAEE